MLRSVGIPEVAADHLGHFHVVRLVPFVDPGDARQSSQLDVDAC
jgi:hypothetical protein